jgi:hypothetical protein
MCNYRSSFTVLLPLLVLIVLLLLLLIISININMVISCRKYMVHTTRRVSMINVLYSLFLLMRLVMNAMTIGAKPKESSVGYLIRT